MTGVHVNVERFVTETDEMLLVELENGREVWLPFSDVNYIHRKKGKGYVMVDPSLAEKENLL